MRKVVLFTCTAALVGGVALAQPQPPANQSKIWESFLKHYPKRALASHEEGLVAFNLTLDRSGHPTECQVTHSSGHKSLDDETCDLLMMHAEFQPPRDANGNRVALFRTQGVINWRLAGSNAKLVTPTKIAKADPMEKKICRRSPRTGSLAGFDRVCMTARDWDSQRKESMDAAADIQGRKGFTSDPAMSGATSPTWGTPQ